MRNMGIYEVDGGTVRAFVGRCPDSWRLIVVGNDWRPWNGGETYPVAGRVEVIFRDGQRDTGEGHRFGWRHGVGHTPSEIVAYREIEDAPAAAPADDIAEVRAAIKGASALATDAEKWRAFVAFIKPMLEGK